LRIDDGEWTIRVEMLGFVSQTLDVAVAPGVEPAKWALTLKSVQELIGSTGSVGSSASNGSNGAVRSTPATRSAQTTNASNPSNSSNSSNPSNASNSSNPSNPSDPFGTADGYLVNGSVNNGAASPFAQMAAFGNNRVVGVKLRWHWHSLGNSAWDARPFSFGGAQAPKPSYSDAQVLATFGGPIRMQRWFRNAPNVFFGYQRLVDHTATTQSALVPTLLERGGDFSQSVDALGRPIHLIDPSTGRPFLNGVISR
jgi:hypothetical protein